MGQLEFLLGFEEMARGLPSKDIVISARMSTMASLSTLTASFVAETPGLRYDFADEGAQVPYSTSVELGLRAAVVRTSTLRRPRGM